MANGNIVLDFVTRLKDEMTPALKGAVENASNMAKSTLGTVRAAASAFSKQLGAVGGEISKLAGMGGQLLQGLCNPWTAIASAATIAVTKIYGYYKQKLDEMKLYTEKTMNEINDIFSNSAKKAQSEYQSISQGNARQSQYRDLQEATAAATIRADQTEAAFNISKSYIPRINAAQTSEERAVIEAERDQAIALDARTHAEKQRNAERETASRKVEEAEYRLANAETLAAQLHEKWNLAAQSGADEKTLGSLRTQAQAADKAVTDAKYELSKETHAQAQLLQKHREEQIKNQEAINAADDKLTKAKDAQAKAADKAAKEEEKAAKKNAEKQREAQLKAIDEQIARDENEEQIRNARDTINQLEADNAARTANVVNLISQRDRLLNALRGGRASSAQMQRGMAMDRAMNQWGDAYDYGAVDAAGVPISQVARDRATRYGETADRYRRAAESRAANTAANQRAAQADANIERRIRDATGIALSGKDKDGNVIKDYGTTQEMVEAALRGKKPHGVSDKEWSDFWKRRRQGAGSAAGQEQIGNQIDTLQNQIKTNTDQIKTNTDKIAQAMDALDKAMSIQP